jgi:AI-2 transport protein TqsA
MDDDALQARLQTACLMILAVVALGGAGYWLAPVLVPFTLAIFITYCLAPIIDLLMRVLKAPRLVAVGVTLCIGVAILLAVGLIGTITVNSMLNNITEYKRMVAEAADDMLSRMPLEAFNLDPVQLRADLIEKSTSTLTNLLSGMLNSVMSLLSNGMVVLIFVIFMVLGRGGGAPHGGMLGEIETRVKRYIVTMVSVSAITGILVGLTLTLLGVQYGWLFGFLAFLMNFIPNIGSAIATLLPLPVVLLDPNMSGFVMVMAIIIPATIQFVIGNIVAPRMMGKSLDLHPVVILLALVFFGMLWGIPGMFLATPIAAVIKIILERIPSTQPIARLMAGNLSDMEGDDPLALTGVGVAAPSPTVLKAAGKPPEVMKPMAPAKPAAGDGSASQANQ